VIRTVAVFSAVGLALLMPAPAAGAESAEDLVARSIEHHGGALYTSSRTTLLLCSKSGCSELEVERDGGLYEYCATAAVKAGQRRVCISNDSVDERLDGSPVVGANAPGSPAHGARESALRDWVMERVYFAFLPSRLDDPSVRHEDLGYETWEGRELRKVKVTFEAGSSTDDDDEFLHWFDPETARLVLFAYSYERNDGGLRFRRLTSYRRVSGILFFNQENYGVDGPGLSVDLVTPDYFRDSMRHVSTVELRDIQVSTLQ
jgi:hypothetical protein